MINRKTDSERDSQVAGRLTDYRQTCCRQTETHRHTRRQIDRQAYIYTNSISSYLQYFSVKCSLYTDKHTGTHTHTYTPPFHQVNRAQRDAPKCFMSHLLLKSITV